MSLTKRQFIASGLACIILPKNLLASIDDFKNNPIKFKHLQAVFILLDIPLILIFYDVILSVMYNASGKNIILK